MRTDLPWNVAGIPPEAREAARAAARREGLAVGEWLTRRILRSFSDDGDPYQTVREDWPMADLQPRAFEDMPMNGARPMTNLRDTQDMMLRVDRSESQTQSAYKRIEDQLRGMARRLEATERGQSEGNRAINQAAAEINVASREQAQAFEQLGTHVIALGERIERIELQQTTDGVKDAVKALHQGLSRLADQIADTANQSASQIGQMANTLEAVVGKMGQVQDHADQTSDYVSQRMNLIDDRVKAVETAAHVRGEAVDRAVQRMESSHAASGQALEAVTSEIETKHESLRAEIRENFQGVDQRYAAKAGELQRSIDSMEERQRTKTADLRRAIDALDEKHTMRGEEFMRAMASLETRNAAKSDELKKLIVESNTDASEVERQAGAISQLGETVNRLTARVATSEVQSTGSIARLEESVGKIESQTAENQVDRRVYGLERALADIVGRLDTSDRNHSGLAGSLEDNLKSFGSKLDAADRRTQELIAELRANIRATSARLDIIEGVSPQHAMVQAQSEPASFAAVPSPSAAPAAEMSPASLQQEAPAFEPPPFPDALSGSQDNQAQPVFGKASHADPDAFEKAFAAPPPAYDSENGFGGDHPFSTEHARAAEGMDAAPPADGDQEQPYLMSARRSATSAGAATLDDASMRSSMSGFSWGATPAESDLEESAPRTRTMLIGGIALIAILAVGAGVLLSSHLAPHQAPAAAAFVPTRPTPMPIGPQTAPSSPVVQPAQRHASASTVKPPRAMSLSAEPKPNALMLPPPSATASVGPAVSAPIKTASIAPLDRLTALANAGNAKAQLLVGLTYLQGDGMPVNEAEAAKWLQRAAQKGQVLAEYRLGTLYERGKGVAADPAKAAHWYEAAARQGNRKAMHNLAVAYASGAGVKKDYAEASRWFAKAASLGLADSEFNLAVLYERGLGVPQSLTDAYKWYAIAAAQGDGESKARIGALQTQLNADERTAAQKAADSFKPVSLNRAANIPPELPASKG